MSLSTFTWLDYDEAQAKRAGELIRSLSDPETIDSIGIGSIRDGIAGLLVPGTSTIQTRVRYFLLVPWAMQHVARRRPRNKTSYKNWLLDAEEATINCLLAGNPIGTTGIIGSERGRKTQRLPTSVYWASLAQWGIRRDERLTLSGYRNYAMSPQSREFLQDETADASAYVVFDELPDPPEGFLEEPLGILPTPEEARYLLGRMESTRLGGVGGRHGSDPNEPSLLSVVARHPEWSDIEAPWDLPGRELTSSLDAIIDQARLFSLVLQGARLRYVQLLFDAQRRFSIPVAGQKEDELRGFVADWTEELSGSLAEVRQWAGQLNDMFDLLARHGVDIIGDTQGFVGAWSSMAVADPERAMASVESANLVARREESIKKPNHRLANRAALGLWKGSLFGARPLDYRWGIASTLVRDCRRGLEAADAGA